MIILISFIIGVGLKKCNLIIFLGLGRVLVKVVIDRDEVFVVIIVLLLIKFDNLENRFILIRKFFVIVFIIKFEDLIFLILLYIINFLNVNLVFFL